MRSPISNSESAAAGRTARRLIAPLRAEILQLAQKLVRTNTVAMPPEGNEAPGQLVLSRFLRSRKVHAELYDTGFIHESDHPFVRRERQYYGRPNLAAGLPGTGGGRSLLLNGHMDTVPPGPDPWRDGAFSGAIRRGRLHGRGSVDMKGGLAAQAGALLALRRSGIRLAGDLLFESVVDEEWAGGGGTLAARLRGGRADACLISEVTGLEIYRATRGGHFSEIRVRAGNPARYFSREAVVGPAVPAGRILSWIDRWAVRRRRVARGKAYAGFADPAPVQVLGIGADRLEPDTPWRVPREVRIRVYFQFLPHEDMNAVICEIRESFDAFCRKDPFFRLHRPEWRDLVYPPLHPHELAADHPWTVCLESAATAVLRKPAAITAAEYPCDAFLLQDHFGIPTLLFGPEGGGAHNEDEYVTTRSLIRTAEVILAAALLWCC
jgi:acetylornithine deacetylase